MTMEAFAESTVAARRPASAAVHSLTGRFWTRAAAVLPAHPETTSAVFQGLVSQVKNTPGLMLFDAVEAGVPTQMVEVIASTLGLPASSVMDMLGVSLTTLRRKEQLGEPLPDAAGHRVMGLLRLVATLRRLLEESADPAALKRFDVEAWVSGWLRQPLPELAGKTPADLLRNCWSACAAGCRHEFLRRQASV
jgi:uncharacterized protein (DUF2384 family)